MLDAGNSLLGMDALADQHRAQVIVQAMSSIGYDAMALGALDLQLGPTALRQCMAGSAFPFLSANVALSTGELFAPPYAIRELDGLKVGLVGLTEPVGAPIAPPGEREALIVQDPLQYGLPHVQAAAKESHLLIVLSHMGKALDEMLASQLPDNTVILGGRDMLVLPPNRYNSTGPIITQAGSRGQIVGRLELTVDRSGKIVSFSGKLFPLDDTWSEDAGIVALLRDRLP